jgi:gas vesicle protein
MRKKYEEIFRELGNLAQKIAALNIKSIAQEIYNRNESVKTPLASREKVSEKKQNASNILKSIEAVVATWAQTSQVEVKQLLDRFKDLVGGEVKIQRLADLIKNDKRLD